MADFDRDGSYAEQLGRPLANLSRISALAPGGAAGGPVASVRRKLDR